MNLGHKNLVLLLLAAGLGVPTWLQLQSDAESFVDLGRVPLLFDGFTSDNVGQILLAMPKAEAGSPEVGKPDEPRLSYDQLPIVRTDSGWVVGQIPGQAPGDLVGAPVNQDRVESDIFRHLRAIRTDRETLVQRDATAEQLASYGLDEAHAFLIKAIDRTGRIALAELLVGNDAGQGQVGTEAVRGVFVRKGDSADVILYEWQSPLRRDVDANSWLDRLLVRVEPDRVRRIAIANASTGGRKVVFERAPGKTMWQAAEPLEGTGAVRQTEVEALVQRFRYLAVGSYKRPLARAGNMQALGLFPPQLELEISEADGDTLRTVQFQVGNRVDGSDDYYLTCSKFDFLMTWPSGTVVPFELDVRTRLFDPAPPAEDRKTDDSGRDK